MRNNSILVLIILYTALNATVWYHIGYYRSEKKYEHGQCMLPERNK